MSVPRDRLAPQDFYNRLDWIRDEWSQDEIQMSPKLCALRRLVEHLPSPWHERAMEHVREIERARIVANVDWREAVARLRCLISERNAVRPAAIRCDFCGITSRGRVAHLEHLEYVHGVKS